MSGLWDCPIDLLQMETKYRGLDETSLRKMKQLEEENRRLKKMYAELSMDHMLLKEIID